VPDEPLAQEHAHVVRGASGSLDHDQATGLRPGNLLDEFGRRRERLDGLAGGNRIRQLYAPGPPELECEPGAVERRAPPVVIERGPEQLGHPAIHRVQVHLVVDSLIRVDLIIAR